MNEKKSLLRQIRTPAQLLVEGRTPEIFFREMVESLGLKDQIQVRDFGSINDLTDYLKDFTQLADFLEKVTSLGIIRDAEDKPASSAFASVSTSLKAVGIEPPDTVGEVRQQTIKVGVFILPDCQQRGMLETLCLRAIPEHPDSDKSVRYTTTLKCVDNYYECLEASEIRPGNIDKAKTWAFLAAQNLSDPQVGRAAQAKIWPWDSKAFEPLRAFLKALSQT